MIGQSAFGTGLRRTALAAFGFASLALSAGSAHAVVIHELVDGEALSFAGAFQSKRLDDGRMTRDYDGFTFFAEPAGIGSNAFVRTSAPSYDYGANGLYQGPLITMSGYTRANFDFVFDARQSAVLFDLNWMPGLTGVQPIVLSIFDGQNRLLETTSVALNGPHGLIGFGGRQSADIARLSITGSFFGLRNMTVSDAVPAGAVPEPATWAMLLLGFFSMGTAIRRRRLATLVA